MSGMYRSRWEATRKLVVPIAFGVIFWAIVYAAVHLR